MLPLAVSADLDYWVAIWTVIGNIALLLSVFAIPLSLCVVNMQRGSDQRRAADVVERERVLREQKQSQQQQDWADSWDQRVDVNEKLRFAINYLFEPSGCYEQRKMAIPEWALAMARNHVPQQENKDAPARTPAAPRSSFKIDRDWLWLAANPEMIDVFHAKFHYHIPVEQFIYAECMYVYIRYFLAVEHALATNVTSLRHLPSTVHDLLYILPDYLPIMAIRRPDHFAQLVALLARSRHQLQVDEALTNTRGIGVSVNDPLPLQWHSLELLRLACQRQDNWLLPLSLIQSTVNRSRYLKFASILALCAFIYRSPTSFNVNVNVDDDNATDSSDTVHRNWLRLERHHMSKQMLDALVQPDLSPEQRIKFLRALPDSMLRKVLAVLTDTPHKSLLLRGAATLIAEINSFLHAVPRGSLTRLPSS
jgi:hypothetical protein